MQPALTSRAQPAEQVPPQQLASDPPGAMASEEEPCTLSSLSVELLTLVAKNLLIIPALAPLRRSAKSLASFEQPPKCA